jgi:hypothetical protein
VSRLALVITRRSGSYRAKVDLEDRLVHATDVVQREGSLGDIWWRPAVDRTWPIGQIREIRWLGSEVPR